MFGFLKDKLKQAISKFSKDVKEEVDEKVEAPVKEEKIEPKKEISKKTDVKKEKIAQKVERKKEIIEEKTQDKKPQVHAKEKKAIPGDILETKRVEEKIQEIRHPVKERPNIHEHKRIDEKKHHHEMKKEVHIRKEEPTVIDEKKGFFKKLFTKKKEPKPEIKEETKFSEKIEENIIEKIPEQAIEEKKGFFEKLSEVVTKKTLSESKFEELFFELELAMLENNVAVEVIEKIKDDLKKTLMSEKVSRMKTEVVIAESLKRSIDELFDVKQIDLLKETKKKRPYVICFVGVNGSGKTTNLAKLANYLQKKGLTVVIAACDTFRAAAIQQIEEHAKNLDIKLVKHDYGADAAAVAYDAIEHAKAKGKDVVLIDTAGRSHSNHNLMDELEKVVRVSKPDLKIFVGDSLTGNDAVDQAKSFNEKVGIDGMILSKVDVDEKGGAAISVSYVTQKPILFIGTGQTYDDLEEFDKQKIIKNLGF